MRTVHNTHVCSETEKCVILCTQLCVLLILYHWRFLRWLMSWWSQQGTVHMTCQIVYCLKWNILHLYTYHTGLCVFRCTSNIQNVLYFMYVYVINMLCWICLRILLPVVFIYILCVSLFYSILYFGTRISHSQVILALNFGQPPPPPCVRETS